MEIVLVRHGETAWNVEEIFRGRADIELDETGLKQAGLVADYLRSVPVDAVYCGPLSRARRTAEAIASKHGLNVIPSESLNDMDFGQWQGKSVAAVRQEYPLEYKVWETSPVRARLPGGENLGDLRRRAVALAEEVSAKYQGRVIFVSHRAVIKVLTLALLGLDESSFWKIKIDPCSVTVFQCQDSGRVLLKLNDTCFMQSSSRPLADF